MVEYALETGFENSSIRSPKRDCPNYVLELPTPPPVSILTISFSFLNQIEELKLDWKL